MFYTRKTRVFDQWERAQGPIYILKGNTVVCNLRDEILNNGKY